MSKSLVEMIALYTNSIFQNIKITLDEITDMQSVPAISDMPVYKHVYHMLHSLDQWFINPNRYEEPYLHEDDLNSLFIGSQKTLTKEELQNYFDSIKIKINDYLKGLTDYDLGLNPEGCKYSRLILILGQYRHLCYHMGLIHSFIRGESGMWPAFIGLAQFIESKEGKNNL